MKPYFLLFGKMIPVYGICYFGGIFLSCLTAFLLNRRRKVIQGYDLIYSAVFAVLAGVAGAKLLFILVSLDQIIEYQIPFADLLKGGFVFYGGLLGGAGGLFAYTKLYKLKFYDFSDLYCVVIPLGHAVGRVGCFFSGCCYGIPYIGPFAYTYRISIDSHTPIGVSLFPVQLLESLCLLLLFVGGLFLYCKQKSCGLTTKYYLLGYPLLRFSLEFLRGDVERGAVLGLSTSQWISLGIFFTVLLLSLIGRKRQKNNKETPSG